MSESKEDKLFIELYDETYDNVCKYIISRCSNTDDVFDIVQNTYLHLYKIISKGRHLERPVDYIFKIAKNEIFKHYRFISKRGATVSFDAEKNEESQVNSLQLETLLTAEAPNDSYIDLKEIWSYIENLDDITFKIFVLHFQFDEKLTDIAKRLNISESNVKNRLYRTIKKIQKEFIQ